MIAMDSGFRLIIVTCEAARAKEVFAKHVDSVLNKSGKIRNLISDLQKNYPTDETAMKFLVYIFMTTSHFTQFHNSHRVC